jgi:anti-sigma factor RsiW
MNCEWREKTGLYIDGELEPSAEQAFAGHLENCAGCSAAVLEQQELKKAVRLAGKRFSAPPELYAGVRAQMQRPEQARWPWQKWVVAAATLALAVAFAFIWYSRTPVANPAVAQLIDQHTTTLASANWNPNWVDVVSEDRHTVKPWFQGRLPFTFNLPELAKDSPFRLLGGKMVYAQNAPGAELLYQVRQHKISVFIFQARDVHGEPSAGNQSFTVNGWQQSGLQYYVVTDAAHEDAERLRALLEDANRS